MKLLIDTVTVNSPGMRQLLRELTEAIFLSKPKDCEIIILQNIKSPIFKNRPGLIVDNNYIPKFSWFGRLYWYLFIIPKKLTLFKADVFYSLSGIIPQRVARKWATIGTVNNMLPFYTNHIHYYPRFSSSRLRLYLLRNLYIKSTERAHALVFHSHHALKQINNFHKNKIDAKSFIVHTGIPKDLNFNSDEPPQHPYQNNPFFFYFSAIYWYKNQLKLIDAYKKALTINTNLPHLLIAGQIVELNYLSLIKQKIIDLNLTDRVHFLGFIEKNEIPKYLYHATINFFPSICETNSVVQAEIIGMHGVMVCSNIEPMPEVAGLAAVTFDPNSADDIAKVMLELNNNPEKQKKIRENAKMRAKELSWEKCGQVIWQAAMKAFKDFKD